jgi:predicted transcriptional regulator of viral defense system
MTTKKLNRYNLVKVLDSYIIFNVNTLRKLINKNKRYTRLVLHRLKKGGIITRIERNSYTTKKDPFLIASHIIWPSYISIWSALNYHHLTEQLPKVISVISTRSRKIRQINVLNVEISFIKIKPEISSVSKKRIIMVSASLLRKKKKH